MRRFADTAPSAEEKVTIVLDACRPVPLASYLKALGVLRLVAEQADGAARGAWRDGRFHVETVLSREAMIHFFLECYRPTPMLSPWNGGSGFYPGDNEEALDALSVSKHERFHPIRQTVKIIRASLGELGIRDKPEEKADKLRLLLRLRSRLPDLALLWLDAAVLLKEAGPDFPPLLGTGGNDGRLDFSNNVMQCMVELFDPDSGAPRETAPALLRESLFGDATPSLIDRSLGQFAPGAVGGPNSTTGFEGATRSNPWDYVLALEGTTLFAAAATRRIETGLSGQLSAPFTVRASGSGAGNTDITDEASSRGEFWAPLWEQPAGIAEVAALLAEGRATVGRRNAQDGLGFARAVARLGVSRGISAFQRYGFLQRNGKNFFAAPLQQVPVRANPASLLIDQLERDDWLDRFRRFARQGHGRVRSLGRMLDNALFALALHGDRGSRPAQDVVAVLGKIVRYLATSPHARTECPPPPRLDREWARHADDASAEFRLALALSQLSTPRERTGHGVDPIDLLGFVAPIQGRGRTRWLDGTSRDVVWGAGSLEANLRRVVERAMLRLERQSGATRPLIGVVPAPLEAVALWLDQALDGGRVQELLLGLTLGVGAQASSDAGAVSSVPSPALPGAYRLLKPFFCSLEQLCRTGLLVAEDHSLPLPPKLVRLLVADRVEEAVAIATQRLRIAGYPIPRHVAPTYHGGPRLLAGLLVPISDYALRLVAGGLLLPTADSSTPDDPSLEEHDGD